MIDELLYWMSAEVEVFTGQRISQMDPDLHIKGPYIVELKEQFT